ncbi:MAG: sigma-70 family RNA polymerase sigma factor [Cyanomargarita calcarea GSE-NOS-MK-12-04C]|jgi:hypothetical protein|uniref:Sigma-70 family RNA polymerase sigma factor n=1 Tax=Cyanomargarita calcarea GSE-NOS-MK-12-04C TaxID=2839659 RepID=A0A951QMQ9_9CYAN|nr:sigma-70 family RNA polymerase sigma factor [Cyanomargarita calcarea GSE-NOS-MK-12-04C]
MNKREDIIQKFSTFLSFGDKNNSKYLFWQTDLKLERQMRHIAESNLGTQADFWARYFLKIAKGIFSTQEMRTGENNSEMTFSSVMAGKHLSAYLQEACFWTAQKLYQHFIFLRHKYSIEEYFQISNSVANPPIKILKNFNLEYSQANIEGYAKTAIIRAVKNKIYQQDVEAKRTKFSGYGLLKDLSKKELKESLESAAINQEQINLYCLVCQCFDEIYQASDGFSGRSLSAPNQKQLQEIALCYNQRCSQLNFNANLATEETIQEMLTICIKLAREYRTKNFLPLEDKYENIIDLKPNLWDIAIESEEREEVYLLISRLFMGVPEIGQIILKLSLGLNLTQTEIAIVLGSKYPELQKQYQIARQLAKITKNLLSDFIQEWNKTNPENLIHDDKNTEIIKDSLIDCLQLYCQRTLSNLLVRAKNQLTNQEKILLFAIRKNKSIGKTTLKQSSELSIAFQNELESDMHLNPNSLFTVNNKLADFIDNCL